VIATQDLSVYHLLVVRPQTQGQQWATTLEAMGATVSLQPMMNIVPLTDAVSEREIINHVLGFAEYQKVIFISQNAVTYGMQWLDQYWPQLPIDIEFFAIGQATAELLEVHMQAGILHYSPEQAMNSEALLAHAKLQQVSEDKILIFRGKEGREYLAEQLMARGAIVAYCDLYQRQSPSQPAPLIDAFRHTQKQPVLAVHSGETLENVCEKINAEDVAWLKQQPVLLPGERVADMARQAGFTNVITAKNATHESMVAALSADTNANKNI
jgi:uroporphyrinogen-III synthase